MHECFHLLCLFHDSSFCQLYQYSILLELIHLHHIFHVLWQIGIIQLLQRYIVTQIHIFAVRAQTRTGRCCLIKHPSADFFHQLLTFQQRKEVLYRNIFSFVLPAQKYFSTSDLFCFQIDDRLNNNTEMFHSIPCIFKDCLFHILPAVNPLKDR